MRFLPPGLAIVSSALFFVACGSPDGSATGGGGTGGATNSGGTGGSGAGSTSNGGTGGGGILGAGGELKQRVVIEAAIGDRDPAVRPVTGSGLPVGPGWLVPRLGTRLAGVHGR